MDLERIKSILALVREHDLAELEIEEAGVRLKVRQHRPYVVPAIPAAGSPPGGSAAPRAETPQDVPASVAQASNGADDEREVVVKSPIVGTFYRSPSPESDPFAEIGQRVSPGKVLCIIESMKLMNEIESDVAGEILEVFPSNGAPVEYGERLFSIRTAA
jgi:acetyl-CoA carboxylase biotin carboxyl carrier protein